jgi:hypothetical protein
MTTSLPLSESITVVLDGSGGGTAKLGPTGPSETWTPSSVSVLCSSNTNEAICKIYAGPTPTAQYFKDLSVDGSTGDATDRANVPVGRGHSVWAVWSGGDAGATATLNVDGVKTI